MVRSYSRKLTSIAEAYSRFGEADFSLYYKNLMVRSCCGYNSHSLKLIDIGCGDGHPVIDWVDDMSVSSLIGFDKRVELIEKASSVSSSKEGGGSAAFQCCDLDTEEGRQFFDSLLVDRSYDTATCNFSLMKFGDLTKVIAAVAKKLHHNGVFAFATFGGDTDKELRRIQYHATSTVRNPQGIFPLEVEEQAPSVYGYENTFLHSFSHIQFVQFCNRLVFPSPDLFVDYYMMTELGRATAKIVPSLKYKMLFAARELYGRKVIVTKTIDIALCSEKKV